MTISFLANFPGNIALHSIVNRHQQALDSNETARFFDHRFQQQTLRRPRWREDVGAGLGPEFLGNHQPPKFINRNGSVHGRQHRIVMVIGKFKEG